MVGFIVANIDALISIFIGVYCMNRASRVPASERDGRMKVLAFCGPVLLGIGVIRLLGAELSHSHPVWSKHTTDDGHAIAEFPGKPEHDARELNFQGVPIKVISEKYVDVRSGTALALARTPLPPTQLSPDEIIEDMIASLTQQGFVIDSRRDSKFGEVWGQSLRLHHKENKVAALFRVGVAHGNVYRALGNIPGGASQEQDVRKFLDSFEIH